MYDRTDPKSTRSNVTLSIPQSPQSVEKKIKMTKPTYITKRTLRTQEKEIADLKFAVKLLEESKAALVPMKNQVTSLISTYEAELAEVGIRHVYIVL